MTKTMSSITKQEYRKVYNGWRYYDNLIKVGYKLNAKQQIKYDELDVRLKSIRQLRAMNKPNEEEDIEHRKIMIEKNKERSKQQYIDNGKYCFGSLKFNSIKAAKHYFNDYLTNHEESDNISDPDIVALVFNHPVHFNSETQHIEIRSNPSDSHNIKNFVIVDNDDNDKTEYLSLYSCITGKCKKSQIKPEIKS